MKQIVYVLYRYVDYNQTENVAVVSSKEDAEYWRAVDLSNNYYEEFVVDGK